MSTQLNIALSILLLCFISCLSREINGHGRGRGENDRLATVRVLTHSSKPISAKRKLQCTIRRSISASPSKSSVSKGESSIDSAEPVGVACFEVESNDTHAIDVHELADYSATDCDSVPISLVPNGASPLRLTQRLCPTSHKSNEIPIHIKRKLSKSFNLTILFTSDIHGNIYQMPRLKAFFRERQRESLETQNSNILLLDIGDISIGSKFARFYNASVIAEIMEDVGYHAMTVGNHDLEYLKELPKKFPLLSINAATAKEKGISGRGSSPSIHPSLLVDFSDSQGFVVGLIGFTYLEGTDAKSLAHEIKREALCLRGQGAAVIVLMAHGGSRLHRRLAAYLRGAVDVTIGGHSHDTISCGGMYHRDLVLAHPGHSGSHVGILQIYGEESLPEGKNSTASLSYLSVSSEVRDISLLPFTPEDAAGSSLGRWIGELRDAMEKTVSEGGYLIRPPGLTDSEDCFREQCLTGKVITEAISLRDGTVKGCPLNGHGGRPAPAPRGGTIVLFESGSIRGKLDGPLRLDDLKVILPWENRMVMYRLKGSTLRGMLDHSHASRTESYGRAYLQTNGVVFMGRDLTIYIRRSDSVGCRETDYSTGFDERDSSSSTISGVDGNGRDNRGHRYQKLESDSFYEVLITDWIAGGGDGYSRYLNAEGSKKLNVSDYTVLDAVARYLRDLAVRSDTNSTFSTQGKEEGSSSIGISASGNENKQDSTSSKKEKKVLSAFDIAILLSSSSILAEIPSTILVYPFHRYTTIQQTSMSALKPRYKEDDDRHDNRHGYENTWESFCRFDGVFLMLIAIQLSKTIFWLFYYPMISILESYSNGDSTVAGSNALEFGLVAFYASTISGVFSAVITNPLWVMITNVQISRNLSSSSSSSSFSSYLVYCNGIWVNILLVCYPSIRQFLYEYITFANASFAMNPQTNGSSNRQSALIKGLLGCIATMLATVVTYPLQSVRTRLQAGMGNNLLTLDPESDKNNNSITIINSYSKPSKQKDSDDYLSARNSHDLVDMNEEGRQFESYLDKLAKGKKSNNTHRIKSPTSSSPSTIASPTKSIGNTNQSSNNNNNSNIIGKTSLYQRICSHLAVLYYGLPGKLVTCAIHGFTFYFLKEVIDSFFFSK